MKAKLEYNIEKEDEALAFYRATKATEMYCVLFELSTNLNKRLDWILDQKPKLTAIELKEAVMLIIDDELRKNNVNIEELS